ncbi:MAG: porin [Bacteroidaceae bacterium]|nr:porin [Bacteroidaceae bacterium]
MKKILTTVFVATLATMPMWAENDETQELSMPAEERIEVSEFEPNGTPGAGFITELVNNSLSDALQGAASASEAKPQLGRKLTDFASAPKFGGYFIGKYAYSDQDGAKGGAGFTQRLTRLYVDGTILTDFKYRLQAQVNNSSFHMKDYFLEWSHWKELAVKVGQYKRAFLFENPYNPWDVGAGDYSQISNQLAGISDKDGNVGNGGRDQGLQVQGDLFPAKNDGHRFIHYQLQVMNGQGINTGDKNGRKDFIGSLQVQPVKDLFIGIFGWTGDYVLADGTEVDRNRWAASVKYEHNDWTARFEYAHAQGILANYAGEGKADGWYATVGVPCTPWLKVYGKYDAYRADKTWGSTKTIYSIIPNFQIHKNLMLQVQYNHVHDRKLVHKDYNELWGELYVRF